MYKKGDIVAIASTDGTGLDKGIVIQADWFNIGGPPSYIISLLSDEVYHELDFRPVITPDKNNNLPTTLQTMVDKLQVVKCGQVLKKVGVVTDAQIAEINGCIKAILGL